MSSKNILSTISIVLLMSNLSAEIIKNPDANTLWIENGVNISTGKDTAPGCWNNTWLNIKSLPEDGFAVSSPESDMKGHDTVCLVDVSPDYPWLIFEITSASPKAGVAYSGFSFIADKLIANRIIKTGKQSLSTGIYCIKTSDVKEIKNTKLRLYVYGAQLEFRYIKMVKEPDCYIEILAEVLEEKKSFGIGDTITFRVHTLRKAPKDVSLQFCDPYNKDIAINGSTTLQLLPEPDTESKAWSATIKIESIKYHKDILKAGEFNVKATVLGGGVKMPLWTSNAYPFLIKK